MSTAAARPRNMPTESSHTRLEQPAARNLVYCLFFIIVAILLPSPAIAQTSSSTCGPKFPEACTCGHESYENSLAYVVNCTNAGLRNTTVLTLMPAEVEILIFTGNYIPELPWNVFGSFNDYKNLKIVDMSNNHIRDIRGKSYHRVQHVERLILNHNNLSISRAGDTVNHHHARVFSSFVNLESLHLTDAFADNTSPEFSEDLHDIFQQSELLKLQKLHLEQNEIKNFKDRSVFCALPSLTDLYLGDNNLNEINFEIGCLPNLRFLDLERNKFEYVKTTDLMLLNELESRSNRSVLLIVDFNLNPFVCDCRVSPFYMWVQATNVSVRHKEKLICYRNKNEPLPLMQLDLKSECASAVAAAQVLFDTAAETQHYRMSEHFEPHINGHTATLIFLLIVLTMILVGLLVALVYISRDKFKFMITPVFDNVAKKVQYTSIKDEDCPEVHV